MDGKINLVNAADRLLSKAYVSMSDELILLWKEWFAANFGA